MKIFAAMIASTQVRNPKDEVALGRELVRSQRRRSRMGDEAIMPRSLLFSPVVVKGD
jgi:hypothetical protein